jgi:hypothetical protein
MLVFLYTSDFWLIEGESMKKEGRLSFSTPYHLHSLSDAIGEESIKKSYVFPTIMHALKTHQDLYNQPKGCD